MDQALVYLFRVDHPAKELVEAGRTYTDPQRGVKILTPAGLEVQIFFNLKDANNVPAGLKEKVKAEATGKGNML